MSNEDTLTAALKSLAAAADKLIEITYSGVMTPEDRDELDAEVRHAKAVLSKTSRPTESDFVSTAQELHRPWTSRRDVHSGDMEIVNALGDVIMIINNTRPSDDYSAEDIAGVVTDKILQPEA